MERCHCKGRRSNIIEKGGGGGGEHGGRRCIVIKVGGITL